MSHPDQPSAAAIDALLAGHALGDLDDGERQQLAALLRQRPELRSRLDEFSTTLDLLPLALPATAAPPARLRRRLLTLRGPALFRGAGLAGEAPPCELWEECTRVGASLPAASCGADSQPGA